MRERVCDFFRYRQWLGMEDQSYESRYLMHKPTNYVIKIMLIANGRQHASITSTQQIHNVMW